MLAGVDMCGHTGFVLINGVEGQGPTRGQQQREGRPRGARVLTQASQQEVGNVAVSLHSAPPLCKPAFAKSTIILHAAALLSVRVGNLS
eukprot:1160775-Pelagomonas_calceolata.AAC.10